MASKLQIEVEVDSSGALKGFKLVEDAQKKVSEGAKAIGDSAGNFDRFASGIQNLIENPLNAAGNAAKALLTSMGPIGTVAAGVGVAIGALAAAGVSAARDLGALGDAIGDTSVRMGLTTAEVSQFRFAMKYAGGDMASLEGTMRKLSQALDDGSEEGQKAREAMREMGIATRDSAGQMRPMSQIILQLSEGFNQVGSTAERNAKAVKILGRSGLEVLPDLLELSAGVKRAKELGLGPSDADINRWSEYQRKIAEVDTIWESLKRKVKEPLAATVLFTYKLATGEIGAAQAGLGANITSPTGGTADRPGSALAFGQDPSKSLSQQYLSNLYVSSLPAGFAAQALQSKLQGALPSKESAEAFIRSINAASETNAAAHKAAANYIARTLEGAQRNSERMKEEYDKARNTLESVIDSGDPAAIRKQRAATEQARLDYERTKDVVSQISKLEASRIANLEKARDLIRQGQGFYRIGSGLLETFVSTEEIAKANDTRRPPSFFRSGNPAVIRQGVINANQDLPEGLNVQSGVFVSPQASRVALQGAQDQLKALGEGIITQATEQQQRLLDERLRGLQIVTSFEERLLELRSEPGKEIDIARQASGIRQRAIEEELRLTGDLTRYREESLQNELDMRLRIAEVQRRQFDDIRNQTEGLLHTLFTDRGSFGSQLTTTIRDAVLKPIEQGIATKITNTVQPIIFGKQGDGGIRGALGSIFGGGTDPAKSAIDSNTAITRDNTAATLALTRAMSLTASGGGGSASGIFGSLSGILGGPGGTSGFAGGVLDQLGLPLGTANPLLFPQLPGASAPNLYGIPGLKDRSVNLPFGLPTNTLSSVLSSGALAAGGTAAIIAGANRGGIGGALGIGAGVAGIAGGVLPLLSKGLAAAGPWGAAIGAGLQLASMLFDLDPKKKRAEQIDKMLESAAYTAPESASFAFDKSGRGFDYSTSGGVRVVNITNNVSAMDAQSFSDFANRNGNILGDVMTGQLDTHGPLRNAVQSTAVPA